MIAALASSSKQKPTATSQMAKMSSAQIKRKRSKLLDLLLNTNWSKQAQQATNLMKLNKILLACDANFIDEKSGESPITLVICSPQLNPTNQHNRSNGAASLAHSGNNTIGCSQSASLFNLQCNSSASHNQLTLKQTSAADICQSSAPLVERILLLLIKSGAQVDFRNKDDQTPLHVAALKSNFWALKTLLDLGASTDYRDINGLTPLYYSILHRAELKITQLLLNYNRRNPSSPSDSNNNNNNIGITDQHGWQEVHQACKLGLDAHLDKLLYYGCDINAKINGSGNTPLHVAAINDQVNCAKVLLLRGADKTITNNSHQTAHQVAVISNNMDLAEFIAEHDETKVVPFNTRPVIPNAAAAANFGSRHSSMIAYGSRNSSSRFSTSSSSQLVNLNSIASSDISQASVSNQLSLSGGSQRSTNTGIVQPQPQHHQQHQRIGQLNPLSLDVPIHLSGGGVDCGRMSNGATSWGSSAPSSHPTSGAQAASQSLLSINTATTTTATATTTTSQQLNVQVNNISPCLSQRSCATSTNTATTSSSGVCCDGEGNNSAEELAHSQSRHSNITIISIGNNVNGNVSTNNNDNKSSSNQDTALSKGCARSNTFEPNNGAILAAGHPGRPVQGACNVNNNDKTGCVGGRANACDNDHTNDADEADRVDEGDVDDEDDGDDDDDLRSSESSSNGLYSLMSDERPLFAGSIVQATSEYQSGDPNHLQLHRGDLMEVLEYPADLIQGGQLPRLANKPLLFGRRQSDSASGLFPSFCVRRHKQRQSSPRQRIAMTDLTNCNHQGSVTTNRQQQCGIRGTSLPDSQSMAALDKQQMGKLMVDERQESGPKFREIQVTLNKFNEGFGFVLRGARIDPATLAARSNGGQNREVAIDENLMAANNLASLQYLDDIEPESVAHKAGLKKGDFLVAVNGHDVRLSSHEQVVNMIRRSGDRVHITIATAAPLTSNGIYSSKTLNRIKPEPPKRDPTTTLTRNKTQRIKSMPIAPQPQHQPHPSFDANKPLPQAPADAMASPTGSLNLMGRSISTNLSHFHSAQSLSSGVPDTQSISSISTISSNEQHQNQFNSPHANGSHQTMNESSSSTTTLTTVATTKPKAPAKPNGIHLKAANLCTNDASSSEPTYHPAVITTNLRTSPTNMNSPKKSPAKAPTNPVTSSANPIQNNALSTSTGPPPPPPPPPPPLPDFSVTPTKDRLNQRRTSAPINQSAELIERSRLLRKRESLAVVGSGGAMASGGGSTQMSAVAAACAAAANNRLQRQRQRELEESTENHSDQTPVVKPDRCQPTPIEDENTPKPPVANGVLNSCTNDEASINSVRSRAADFSKSRPPSPVKSQEPPILVSRKSFSGTQTMSASLGRRASAQIIQQPKPGYMSQTLKPKSKRPPIPSYEDMPPPPPPLPASLPEQEPTIDRIKSNEVQTQPNYRHHHHHHHHHHQQLDENQSVKVQRQSKDLSQLKQQQQLQIRQQQFRQQQMLLQQQHQQQQQQHHHHHNHHVHQPSSCQKSKHTHDGQCYNATIARSRFSHELVEPTQVQPQLHHHQNAQPSATRSSTQHRHHHHHHHGHHHHQPDADIRTLQRQQYVQTVQHPGAQSTPHSQSSHLQNAETNYHNHHPQRHVHPHQLHHHHHYQHQNQQQQHLYQQLQQQQFIERYLPLVYSTDSYAATLER